MKKLPVGIQSFSELRKGGYLYIDKTEYIYNLATQGKYYFLSRPRRFGKSLLISTLSELFQGNQSLFEGLWVEPNWDWQRTFPIVHLSLNSLGYKEIGFDKALALRLEKIAAAFGITLQSESNPLRFQELIEQLYAHLGQVVVLIDEYDKPILDNLHDLPMADKYRETLKSFYSILKDADPYLRLVLLTGVSKFSRVSIFSELNNLKDLTMHPKYAVLLGYSQTELEFYFSDRIEQLASNFGGRESLLGQIRQWYNGYTWDGVNSLYNPFSILNFFDQERFENFWFETGTPTFLVKLLHKEGKYDFEHVMASSAALGSFELERIHPITLLFQTGYLTIRKKEVDFTYILSYPNKEVRHSLLQHLLAEYTNESPSDTYVSARQMKQALESGDLASFVQSINSLFASIPYQIFIEDKEAYYHSVIFLALSLMDTFVHAEVSQSKGRPDAVIFTTHTIYVLEFKLDDSAENALIQIKEKNYTAPYLGKDKKVMAVGLNFSSQEKAIIQWKEEVEI